MTRKRLSLFAIVLLVLAPIATADEGSAPSVILDLLGLDAGWEMDPTGGDGLDSRGTLDPDGGDAGSSMDPNG